MQSKLINKGTNKICVCVMEYYPIIKKNEILPFVTTWMNPEAIMLSEISQTQKHKFHIISLRCRI